MILNFFFNKITAQLLNFFFFANLNDKRKFQLMEYHRRQVITGLSDALSHAAISMLVTSATTAVAFFTNLVSDIMVLRLVTA